MSLTYGFYDSLDGDRKYNAGQLSALFSDLITDGVFPNSGSCFEVLAGSGMNVTVGTGRSWMGRTWTDNDAPITLTFDESHPTLDRIDTVIIEVKKHSSYRENLIRIVKGIAATNPVRANIVRGDWLWQYALATVLIPAGSTSIQQVNITNIVGLEETPYITGVLTQISADAIVARLEAEFDNWFGTLQDELNENQAANLQGQITGANNTLFGKIVSTGANDEFVLNKIPAGFDVLRLVGIMKSTQSSGADAIFPVIRLNDETGLVYPELDLSTGLWRGWSVNTSINNVPVVTNVFKNSGIYTWMKIEVPLYASPSMTKWVHIESWYAGGYPSNPAIPGTTKHYNVLLTDPITKVSISGAYLASTSWLKALLCAE